jgi:hypothetical protein
VAFLVAFLVETHNCATCGGPPWHRQVRLATDQKVGGSSPSGCATETLRPKGFSGSSLQPLQSSLEISR